jgi:AcrR family transcriptional regulator
MSQSTTARRGRPRDSEVDRRVLAAARGLLHAGGYAALNVDEVAERAAVAKTTLYRRWPTKDHLAIAVAAQILGEVPIPDTGHLRRDLTEFAAVLAASLNRLRMAGHYGGGASAGLAAEMVAAAARHPDIGEVVRAMYAQRHAMARARLQRAGLRQDIDQAVLIDQMVGPIYYRILISGAPADRDYAERLVDAVLDGAFTPGAVTPKEQWK